MIELLKSIFAVIGGIVTVCFLVLIVWWKANEWWTNRARAAAGNRFLATRHDARPTHDDHSAVVSRP